MERDMYCVLFSYFNPAGVINPGMHLNLGL